MFSLIFIFIFCFFFGIKKYINLLRVVVVVFRGTKQTYKVVYIEVQVLNIVHPCECTRCTRGDDRVYSDSALSSNHNFSIEFNLQNILGHFYTKKG